LQTAGNSVTPVEAGSRLAGGDTSMVIDLGGMVEYVTWPLAAGALGYFSDGGGDLRGTVVADGKLSVEAEQTITPVFGTGLPVGPPPGTT
jgi:hypothetical protein